MEVFSWESFKYKFTLQIDGTPNNNIQVPVFPSLTLGGMQFCFC